MTYFFFARACALVLAASPLVVTQSLHSRIARALLSERKIKDCSQSTANPTNNSKGRPDNLCVEFKGFVWEYSEVHI